jgi:hypothetical protein
MTTGFNLRTLILAHIAGGANAHHATEKAFAEIEALDTTERDQVIFDLILDVAYRIERDVTRGMERESFSEDAESQVIPLPRSRRPRLDTDGNLIPARNEQHELLSRTIWVPKKGHVAWGEATQQDFKARIEYLSRQLSAHVESVTATVSVLERTAQFIKQNRIRCLNDYPGGFKPSMIAGLTEAQISKLAVSA